MTPMEKDVRVRVNKYSRPPASLTLDIHFSTCSERIKVYPVGIASMHKHERREIKPASIRDESRGIEGGVNAQA